MPSRKYESSTTTTYLPHLSEILKLDPEGEPHCAGIAVSKGRRCQLRTNQYGRRTALSLLDKGTADLRAGLCIDDILQDLAPHVLCTRWHQGQASTLVSQWQRRVDRYLASAPVQRSSGRSPRSPYEGWTLAECLAELDRLRAARATDSVAASQPSARATPTNGLFANAFSSDSGNASRTSTTSRTVERQPVTNATPTIRRPEPVITADVPPFGQVMSGSTSNRIPTVTPIATRANPPDASSTARSALLSRSSPAPTSNRIPTATPNTPGASSTDRSALPSRSSPAPTSNRIPTATPNTPGASSTDRSALPSRSSPAPTSNRIPTATPNTPGASSTTRPVLPSRSSPAPTVRPREVTRRSVHGDCSICLDALRKPSTSSVLAPVDADGDGGSVDDNEEEDEDEIEDEAEETDGESEVESEDGEAEKELSWCKAQCGVNYHKKCIDKWLAEADRPTCPSCRRTWKD
ncbi:hypothetical protein BJX63DRAFT_437929 [Aspergillus granulosus]|uniref:RING-type domain-containing protein n=1 Tax=Aspergillus granulosus TaxID=176169 RepID=A0ABR4GTM4_9EURO